VAADRAFVHCLRPIETWPFDATDAFFACYPAMKLGVVEAAEHYAHQLVPLVVDLIASELAVRSWVATAPQRVVLPAGANLLCELLVRGVEPLLPDGTTLGLVDIVEEAAERSIADLGQLRRYNDYSRMPVAERQAAYARRGLVLPREDFAGKGVIYINDINVTGTQLRFLQQRFPEVEPAVVHFVYLISCVPEVGRSYPQLEAEINGFDRMDAAARSRILSRRDLRHTAKCLSTLMALPYEAFAETVALLSTEVAAGLRRVYDIEARFEGPLFSSRLALLDRQATADG
jgi:hypothetical protein